jgi:hypothetical protein
MSANRNGVTLFEAYPKMAREALYDRIEAISTFDCNNGFKELTSIDLLSEDRPLLRINIGIPI